MNLDKVFYRSDRVVSRKIVDELILVPIRSNVAEMDSLYTLNDVGARIYELVDGTRSVREICDAIHQEFDVSREQAEADVVEFIEKLLSIGSIAEE